MPGGMIFDYKCDEGHKSSKIFPARTEFDKHNQVICPQCMLKGEANYAYLIFACPEPPQRKS